MSVIKGFPSKLRDINLPPEDTHVTAQVLDKQIGLNVIPLGTHVNEYSSSETAEAGSTTRSIVLTGHTALVGDLIRFTLSGKEVRIHSISGNTLSLGEVLDTDPTGLTFSLHRGVTPAINADGTIPTGAASLQFIKNGSPQTVIEDTVTPANNAPLPVKLTGITGDINITAGDLNVQTSHSGASFDSIRIGDGADLLAISASGAASVEDSAAHTKLDSLLTELQLKADLSETQPVSLASIPLATGAATESKQDSIILELQDVEADIEASNALLTTIDADTSSLVFNVQSIDSKTIAVDTNNVTVISSALPSGAATLAGQQDIVTELQDVEADIEAGNALLATIDVDTSSISSSAVSIDGKITAVDTGNVTITSSALPTGAATATNQASMIAELQDIEADVEAGNGLLTTIDADTSSMSTSLSNIDTSTNNIEADIDALEARVAGALVPEAHDYISLAYVTVGNGIGEIETVIYKTGGSGGTTVATLTLAYSVDNKLTSVTRT